MNALKIISDFVKDVFCFDEIETDVISNYAKPVTRFSGSVIPSTSVSTSFDVHDVTLKMFGSSSLTVSM